MIYSLEREQNIALGINNGCLQFKVAFVITRKRTEFDEDVKERVQLFFHSVIVMRTFFVVMDTYPINVNTIPVVTTETMNNISLSHSQKMMIIKNMAFITKKRKNL